MCTSIYKIIPHSSRETKNYVKFRRNMNVYYRHISDGYVMSNNSDGHNLCLFNLSSVRLYRTRAWVRRSWFVLLLVMNQSWNSQKYDNEIRNNWLISKAFWFHCNFCFWADSFLYLTQCCCFFGIRWTDASPFTKDRDDQCEAMTSFFPRLVSILYTISSDIYFRHSSPSSFSCKASFTINACQ